MKPELEKKFNDQTNELYASIGKACVKFELICHGLRSAILQMLGGDSFPRQKIFQAVLAELTAQPLLSIYQALIAETLDLTVDEKNIVNKLCKQVINLIERRNDIIHATWFVGYAGALDEDFSRATGHKWKRGKDGAFLRSNTFEAKDFEGFANECDDVANTVMFLPILVLLADAKIGNNFYVTSDGKVARKNQVEKK